MSDTFMPSLGTGQPVQPAPAAKTDAQISAEAKAEMDTYKGESRDYDPDATGEHEVEKPKKLPAEAADIEKDNSQQTPAIEIVDEDAVDREDGEGDEDGEGEGEGDEDEDEGEKEPKADDKKPKKTVAERIKEMTRARGEAQRLAETTARENIELRARLEALEKGEKPPKAKGDTPAADVTDKPDPSKFKYGEIDPDYIAAVVEFETDKRLKAADEKREKAAQEQARAARLAELETARDTMAEKGVAEYGESYMDVVIQGAIDRKWPVSPIVAQLTLDSDVGHKVAHYLATHPKEAREVYGKGEIAQAAYFGRLEAKFLSGGKPAAPKTQDAPRVPNPPKSQVRGGGGKFQVTADTEDFAAFEAMANRKP